jgi:hypothetical protein
MGRAALLRRRITESSTSETPIVLRLRPVGHSSVCPWQQLASPCAIICRAYGPAEPGRRSTNSLNLCAPRALLRPLNPSRSAGSVVQRDHRHLTQCPHPQPLSHPMGEGGVGLSRSRRRGVLPGRRLALRLPAFTQLSARRVSGVQRGSAVRLIRARRSCRAGSPLSSKWVKAGKGNEYSLEELHESDSH